MKNGNPAIKGWVKTVITDIFELGRKMEKKGAGYILFSCVEADGAYTGPDIMNTKKMIDSVTIPVIAAGGVSSTQDIINLKSIGVNGVIVGKAFYDKRINFQNVKHL
jgi:phosphoribosylformimino-5-aminoimidazole carboxamide ribotide isomerase